MNLRNVLIACMAALGLAACAWFTSGPAFVPDSAQSLTSADRSVMEQPREGMTNGIGPDLIFLCDIDVPRGGVATSLGQAPKRFELAPGKHSFAFDGGQSWLHCVIDLDMRAGHTYRPLKLEGPGLPDCKNGSCSIKLLDTPPSGDSSPLRLRCASDKRGHPLLNCP